MAIASSVKDGKREAYNPEDDEDLHCIISAESEDRLQKGVAGTCHLVAQHAATDRPCPVTHGRMHRPPCPVRLLSDRRSVGPATAAVLRVIEIAKSVPEEFNDMKRQQLRELAALNG